ncbi:MAG TPA: diacylglycerol kinase family protein [Anaerolineales bacterium]
MTAKVILNPYAGRWSAGQRREEMVAALKAAGIDFDLAVTQGPGDGVSLAAQAVREGFSPIIAAGGDGSISEVVNGMAQAVGEDPLLPLGIIPLGSANDLVDNLKMPKDLLAAARLIAGGQVRNLDLCQVTGNIQGRSFTRYFDNNAAIGLEPFITLIQQRIHRLKGTPRYLVATLRGVMDNPQWTMRLEWEGGSYQGPVTLVTVGNNPRTGGLFYVTPHADPSDGLLTFVYGFLPTRLQILRVLPRLMKPGPGSYVEHPSIHEIHSPWLRIHSENPTPLHADGEIQSEAIQDMEFCVLPGRLPVLAVA